MHTFLARATGLALAIAGLGTTLTVSYVAGLAVSLTAAGYVALLDRADERRLRAA